MHGSGSVLGANRMDHSFVVLPEQRNQTPGFPPCHRTGGNQYPVSPPVASLNHFVDHAVGPFNKDTPGQAAHSGPDSHGGKAMDESFVMLPAPAASMYRYRNSPEGGSLPFPNNVGNLTHD